MSEVNETDAVEAEVRLHEGKPTIFINGEPNALPLYSPSHGGPWVWAEFQKEAPRFFPHRMGAYFVHVPCGIDGDFDASPFWHDESVTLTPDAEQDNNTDAQADLILNGDPNTYLIVRFAPH